MWNRTPITDTDCDTLLALRFVFGWGLLAVILPVSIASAEKSNEASVKIGSQAKVPTDPRQKHARFVIFRPGDGQTVSLNPPRFSWPYLPDIVLPARHVSAEMRFTLQISASATFDDVYYESPETDCNFYNFIPELKGARRWYWRVKYRRESGKGHWSGVRSFTLAPDATVWDRSRIPAAIANLNEHPRILFNRANLNAVRALRHENEYSAGLYDHIIHDADNAIKQDWYRDFPHNDTQRYRGNVSGYMNMTIGLLKVAWAHKLTGHNKYTGYKENFLKLASYPPGGKSSPEGIAGNTKWNTHLTEYLGLFYDWCYHDLTPRERAVVRKALEWRISHTLNNYAWKRDDGERIRYGSIAVYVASHPYENSMVSLAGALSIADESPVARKALEIWTHYLIGITNGMGADQGWNEGPGYGNGKMKWLTDAAWYLHTALPEAQLGKNKALVDLCDFFSRITPLGARHCSFGNRGKNELDWCRSRITTMRRVATLCNGPEAMQNWLATRARLKGMLGRDTYPAVSPWIDYFMPLYNTSPAPRQKQDFNRLFALEGWVTVNSAPPSNLQAQQDAVSMTFHCRPRGGYSHSFRSENAFDIHAFGNTITVGGGTTSNQSWFANHTMSHNTVLVNGKEQLAAQGRTVPFCGRVIAYQEGSGYVYWAGDATAAYGPKTDLGRFVRHVLFVDDRYFVIYDDLQMADDADPGVFQWLYHIIDPVPLRWNVKEGELTYSIGEANVTLRHVAHTSDLTMENRRGKKGMINPITDEDLTRSDKWARGKDWKKLPRPLDAHHLWFSHKTPRRNMQYLVVIVPSRSNQKTPIIASISDTAVRVTFGDKETTISFGEEEADIQVDPEAVLAEQDTIN